MYNVYYDFDQWLCTHIYQKHKSATDLAMLQIEPKILVINILKRGE